MASDDGEAAKNIEKAQQLKEEGNAAFKAGDYKKAMTAYHHIFTYVNGYSGSSAGPGAQRMPGQTTQPVTPEQAEVIKELKLVHFNNLAMCHLKLNNIQKAKANCSKALAIEPSNVKALFRRGKCLAQLGELDEAKEDFEHVLNLQPDNKDAARELRGLKPQFAALRKKEAKRFAGMFDKLQADVEMEEAAEAAATASSADGGAGGERSASGEGDVASASADTGRSTAAVPAAAANTATDVSDAADPAGAGGTNPLGHTLVGLPPLLSEDTEDIGAPLGPPQPFEPSDVYVARPGAASGDGAALPHLGADPAAS